MQPVVETLSGLERRVDLSVPVADIEKEVETRLKRLARTAKMPGFRPGKVPLPMLARTYGPEVRMEVLNAKIGDALEKVVAESKLRLAGSPSVEPKTEGVADDVVAFSATFEVYPEVAIPDLTALEVTSAKSEVGDAEVDRTVDILRKQRVTFEEREGRAAGDDDRVTLDFAGTIDGVAFQGGTAEDFPFVLGQGRMLPEFEAAARGMKAGETKVFPLTFPADYGSAEVAGKTAEFTITVKKVEEGVLPQVDAEFAKQLGQAEGDVEKLRADIRANLEREVRSRTQARTKSSVMDALAKAATFDIPKALVNDDTERRIEAAREDLRQRGVPNADKLPIPAEAFASESERRVRLGLLVSELVKAENLKAKPDQIRARIEDFAQSYEKPEEVVRYYLTDKARLAEIEAIVLEDNVVQHVLSKAKVKDEQVSFDELMGTA
ncbi:trigger factor [Pigmentiphaga sp. GD03639]|uniref:Trigger factor n=1 Tax=Pigmentiphaga daeguensis TaxID=414049 RepID=A0ABN1CRK9_9BURK|nr:MULTISPECIES: trigger factor [unclassified Pigmentiphaga]MDH2235932.1 trigger factor [Pigmentiphaga sp. GD03639]OVZ60936.1 trigger factor [Pigmentiphaga sp. NML030171]